MRLIILSKYTFTSSGDVGIAEEDDTEVSTEWCEDDDFVVLNVFCKTDDILDVLVAS